MPRNVIGILFGSEVDVPHVKLIVDELERREWKRLTSDGYSPDDKKIYALEAGSVHRDLRGTLRYVTRFSRKVRETGDRLIYLTCIGINDDASGVIASQTGEIVVAVPPDSKRYPPYPKGVRVHPYSEEGDREIDINSALDRVEGEFVNNNWEVNYSASALLREKAREKLDVLRAGLSEGRIEL